ncbi:MAG: F0F1 ATP synthase subunit B [Bacteroidales bacterium]|jgi:F-type H+-transporting ATPase subunit b|nr:F0F1 ATP synthase subunit B [Bacteroidales bacterium]MBQ5512098.1 F0F1 ATP synthase subunit B [Bacteroidales bacterium]MBQ5550577.1 F0F1 ATP synthase subunit B [Bacteroidales bacterium]MBQ5576824.1 F0F1 ATP synthase subunit B [Bacteroidales bacterium]MBR3711684.1 F0F1 ATP synthase subunit B [Bacteroidales bacterium]
MDLVIPDFGLLFWMVVSFSILLIILRKFAWKPLLKMLQDREDEIAKSLDSANEAKLQMEKLVSSNEAMMREARAEREAMLREAKDAKDKIVAEAQTAAKAEADKIILAARREIEAEKEAAKAELQSKVAELSVEIAEKILRRELSTETKQGEYVEDLVKNISLN